MYLNNVWRPTLAITGCDGMPPLSSAGNVVRSDTALRLSLRLPPSCDSKKALQSLLDKVTTDIPYNAKIDILMKSNG